MERCHLCSTDLAWWTLAVASRPGDRFARAARTPVCDTCRERLENDRGHELADRLAPDFDDLGHDAVVRHLHSRAGRAVRIAPEAPAVTDARERGFVPLRELTGVGDRLGSDT